MYENRVKYIIFAFLAGFLIFFGILAILFNLAVLEPIIEDTSVSYEKYLERIKDLEVAQENSIGFGIARNAGFIIGTGAILIGAFIVGYIVSKLREINARPSIAGT